MIAYLRDNLYNRYMQEDRFFHYNYVEYNPDTGVVLYSEPFQDGDYTPYMEDYYALDKDFKKFNKQEDDFYKNMGINFGTYTTLEDRSNNYKQWLDNFAPKAYIAKTYNSRFANTFMNIPKQTFANKFLKLDKKSQDYQDIDNKIKSDKQRYGEVKPDTYRIIFDKLF